MRMKDLVHACDAAPDGLVRLRWTSRMKPDSLARFVGTVGREVQVADASERRYVVAPRQVESVHHITEGERERWSAQVEEAKRMAAARAERERVNARWHEAREALRSAADRCWPDMLEPQRPGGHPEFRGRWEKARALVGALLGEGETQGEEGAGATMAAFLSAAEACADPMAGASELEALRLAWEALPPGVREDPMGFTRWGAPS